MKRHAEHSGDASEGHPDVVASWKAERRWFRWTVGFTAGLCVWLVGVVILDLWVSNALTSVIGHVGGSVSVEEFESILDPLMPLIIAVTVLMWVAGLGFILSLIKWLLAIRCRRKVQAATGFPTGENR